MCTVESSAWIRHDEPERAISSQGPLRFTGAAPFRGVMGMMIYQSGRVHRCGYRSISLLTRSPNSLAVRKTIVVYVARKNMRRCEP